MKANIPSRIAFAVDSAINSRIILDNPGAEKLVGRGDMLYAPLGIGKPTRVQGCYITPEEIERVVGFVKSTGEAQYSDEVMRKIEESVLEKEKKGGGAPAAEAPDEDDSDELLPAAVEVILETGQASVSMLQRRLKLGYSRAARLVDQMEQKGYVGPFEGSKPRQLLITKAQWQEMQMGSPPTPQAAPQPPSRRPGAKKGASHVICPPPRPHRVQPPRRLLPHRRPGKARQRTGPNRRGSHRPRRHVRGDRFLQGLQAGGRQAHHRLRGLRGPGGADAV